jgi:capsular polysaccharide transport system permease protein
MTSKHRKFSRIQLPRFLRVIFALMMRDMATQYGRSSVGYLWAILEPVGAITVLSLAFSIALQSPALGESFPLFYATGYMPFMLYNAMVNSVGAAMRDNLQLLFYPRVTYVDAIIARFSLTLLTQILVAVIIFVGINLVFGLSLNVEIHRVLIAFSVAAFLGLGVGTLNLVIIFLFPSWRQIWSILNRPIFLVSCIFYLFDSLPTWMQNVLWFNPLVHIIGENRTGFYSIYNPQYINLAFPITVGAVTLFLGLALLRRFSQDLINS